MDAQHTIYDIAYIMKHHIYVSSSSLSLSLSLFVCVCLSLIPSLATSSFLTTCWCMWVTEKCPPKVCPQKIEKFNVPELKMKIPVRPK